MKTMKLAVVAACALALVVAAAATAATPDRASGYRMAKFRVTVKGTQKMVQQHHHFSDDPCDPDNSSSGSETWRFKSKPVIVQAYMIPGDKNPYLIAGKTQKIPVKGTVKRSYTPRIERTPPDICGDNGGGVLTPPTPPDCGTKTVSDSLDLEYLERPRGYIQLSSEALSPDPFENCSGAGGMGYPYLLLDRGDHGDVAAHLPASDLFDPEFRQWISIARGKLRYRGSDYWSEAKVEWDVSWTRLGKR